MTCIVGLVEGRKVFMGADSAGVGPNYEIRIRKDKKLFTLNNNKIIIGCTTSFRMIQLLQFKMNITTIPTKNETFKWMCTNFIDEVRKIFEDNKFPGGQFLVGINGRLFEIDSDFQVAENVNGYESVGCGIDFAMGSLYTTRNKNLSPKERILLALEASSKFSSGVSKPFNIMSI